MHESRICLLLILGSGLYGHRPNLAKVLVLCQHPAEFTAVKPRYKRADGNGISSDENNWTGLPRSPETAGVLPVRPRTEHV